MSGSANVFPWCFSTVVVFCRKFAQQTTPPRVFVLNKENDV